MYIFGNVVKVMKDDVPVRPIEFRIQENGVTVPLTGLTINVKAVSATGVYFDRAATINDAAGGIVHVYPLETETDTVGEYKMYVYNADAPDTYPVDWYVEYVVLDPWDQ